MQHAWERFELNYTKRDRREGLALQHVSRRPYYVGWRCWCGEVGYAA
jgi:hypothetical protein